MKATKEVSTYADTPLLQPFKSLSFGRAHNPLPYATKLERPGLGAPFSELCSTIVNTALLLILPVAVSDQFSR
jgi:hypothetical protein